MTRSQWRACDGPEWSSRGERSRTGQHQQAFAERAAAHRGRPAAEIMPLLRRAADAALLGFTRPTSATCSPTTTPRPSTRSSA
ncbi:hypothetical protein ABTX77_26825 [Streptomyces sp. NPDC097704]|uniref:hypothetical protein n=1 Tax=Streptomyces sp. NPDC097704 TaxID=3157101 RepID=UPI003330260C